MPIQVQEVSKLLLYIKYLFQTMDNVNQIPATGILCISRRLGRRNGLRTCNVLLLTVRNLILLFQITSTSN